MIAVAFAPIGTLVVTLPVGLLNIVVGKGATLAPSLTTPSPRGPAGPAAARNTYTHSQSSAMSVWTVAHNFGYKPLVVVTDMSGNQLFSDVTHVSDSILQVTHGAAMSGFVYCT